MAHDALPVVPVPLHTVHSEEVVPVVVAIAILHQFFILHHRFHRLLIRSIDTSKAADRYQAYENAETDDACENEHGNIHHTIHLGE